ncbi:MULTISPECIES: hypothetical protein [unclassified Leisingera]|uniref:hypothetical protein n=1 Tax=unclassified Leisingera TaxID=2614906 RepID=UPI000360213D|nr:MULTISPECIES: hypothetical protein [unclassified Leisingera]KIC23919.1 hypothetical protein RA23_12880 [Leisingera sp. ANG-S3]KIC24490.1 hypothetical protein RA24_20260 [Leisingera sp. ANG-M6]KIC50544.1 hypothetical protein RA22_19925 [Leisingera sp. ANG-S]KID07765.1 hypothetical protein GC1_17255 [Leisingera sp. ANG1]
MINRRNFVLASTFAVLAGCSQQQLVDTQTASSLRVTEVSVSTQVAREKTAVPKQQILDTVQAKSFSVLSSASRAGSRPVRAHVDVVQFYIANPGLGALIGSTNSGINTEVSLIDIETGEPVGDKFTVNGGTQEVRPGLFGAAMIGAPEKELDEITDSLANSMKIAIFGE